MDPKSIGGVIADLRKKCGITQTDLAERLNISNKTVSRWENGLGFPEITQFPLLASVFGVTVDYLMTGDKKGITIAGNILADIIKNIDYYPSIGLLSTIREIKMSVGGCVPNTAINLAKIDKTLPISALGKVGKDEYGRFVLSEMSRYGIDCEQVKISADKPTSFTDVMNEPSGERTFFHARGANAQFSPLDVDIDAINTQMLHIGYILLLDSFDEPDSEYGTVMAHFLHDVQARGIKTSIDVVSESRPDFKDKIVPALKYCDYAIINEIEAGMVADISAYNEKGELDKNNIRKMMEFIAAKGVKEKIVIHCKPAGFCYDVATGNFTCVPSLNIPSDKIKGSVGAGDAFCAATLYGIYNNFTDKQLLEFASAAAACNLFAENSVDGMKKKEEIEKMGEIYGRKRI
ncbi:MAG: helix-turn-helix domain-containing protein [Clostridia bacterium]|nr:helix-turn-helix domain-containing protein [Clostridia bacterium]